MSERAFVPKRGQVDYTHIRYAPVVQIVVVHDAKLLLVRRSDRLKLYPGRWSGISGFLDDQQSIEEKVAEELYEELGLGHQRTTELTIARPLRQEAPEYHKTWLIIPVFVRVNTETVRLDREASEAAWFVPDEVRQLSVVPGFVDVLAQFFPEML